MNKNIFLFPAACLLLMAGCTADEQPDVAGLVPISLTATMEDAASAGTRAGTALNNSFASGDAFYAYFPENVRVGSTATASNTTFSNNGSAWSPATQPFFNAGTTSATVHAYYGKSGGSSGTQVNNSTTSFSVATDQSGDANYKASDLMYATTTVQKSSPTASLTFTHKMSKILVTANIGAGVTNIQGIRIVGGSRTIDISTPLSCTLGTTLSDANTTSSYITMYSTTSTSAVNCAALIPPQTVSGNFLVVTTDLGDVTYSLDSKVFASGQSYTFNITVNAAAIGTTVAITNWAANGTVTVNPSVVEYVVNPPALQLGDIIYEDGTWSRNDALNTSKIAVGVVVYVAASYGAIECEAGKSCRYGSGTVAGKVLVMSLDKLDSQYWFTTANTDHDNTLFPNCGADITTSSSDLKGYEKTRQMAMKTGECASHTHDAATLAWNYVPSGTSISSPYLSGSTGWFLPSIGQWLKVANAMGVSSSLAFFTSSGDVSVTNKLNNYLVNAGGNALGNYDLQWTSSESSESQSMIVRFWTSGFYWHNNTKDSWGSPRPFIAY